MAKYNIGSDPVLTDEDLDGGNVVEFDYVNQYLCSVRKIAEEQNKVGTSIITRF